jgi:hypothetical protein
MEINGRWNYHVVEWNRLAESLNREKGSVKTQLGPVKVLKGANRLVETLIPDSLQASRTFRK